jgi:hypothetical protein
MTTLDEIEGLRRQCIEGTQRHRAALIAAGYLVEADRPHEDHPALRLLASVHLRPQRRHGKRDKVVLCDLAPYRKPFREWPLSYHQPAHELKPRTSPVTARELANRHKDYLDHSHALESMQALSRVEELFKEGWQEYRDSEPA